jgi:DNA-binding MarR family transcriptional regulator
VSKDIEGLVWETRRLFRALATVADEALKPLGITASDRALIEFLAKEPAAITLAELARKRAVSRQHIHQSLNRLRNPDWIERSADPRDARSVTLRLTAEGQSLWRQIREIDQRLLKRIARRADLANVTRATKTLRAIRKLLQEGSHD